MSNSGPIEKNSDLIAALKQDERNAKQSNEPQATKEHIAGAQGKLASAISQHQGDSDISTGAQRLARVIEPSGESEVDRDAIQKSLHARAHGKIDEQYAGDDMAIEQKSEAARLQSAAEQYDLAREGKQAADQGTDQLTSYKS